MMAMLRTLISHLGKSSCSSSSFLHILFFQAACKWQKMMYPQKKDWGGGRTIEKWSLFNIFQNNYYGCRHPACCLGVKEVASEEILVSTFTKKKKKKKNCLQYLRMVTQKGEEAYSYFTLLPIWNIIEETSIKLLGSLFQHTIIMKYGLSAQYYLFPGPAFGEHTVPPPYH